jgi:hypothetical protein
MTAPVNPLVREAEEKAEEIERKIQEFFDRVNDVISWVPGFLSHLIEPIERGMQALAEKVREFWDRVNQLFQQPGNSERLKEVGERWVTDVGNICGEIAGTIRLDKLKANLEWQGRAAEAYKAKVPAQSEGLNGIKSIAEQMRSSLNSLGDSLDTFWLAIKVAFVSFLVAAVAAIAAACTVVGVPAAIGVIAGALAAAIGLIAATVMALNSHVDAIETQQRTITQAIHNLGDSWNMTDVSTMSDASVRDGDASDWQLIR